MRKIIITSLVTLSLTGCATIQRARDKAVNLMCQHKDTLIALALSTNDIATVKAIDAYCNAPETPPAPVQGL